MVIFTVFSDVHINMIYFLCVNSNVFKCFKEFVSCFDFNIGEWSAILTKMAVTFSHGAAKDAPGRRRQHANGGLPLGQRTKTTPKY